MLNMLINSLALTACSCYFFDLIKPIVDLIEFRYSEQMYTAMTSNLAPKDFADVYGKRIADRLNEMIDIIPFDNTSYRAI